MPEVNGPGLGRRLIYISTTLGTAVALHALTQAASPRAALARYPTLSYPFHALKNKAFPSANTGESSCQISGLDAPIQKN